jgi:hypothetical protein
MVANDSPFTADTLRSPPAAVGPAANAVSRRRFLPSAPHMKVKKV